MGREPLCCAVLRLPPCRACAVPSPALQATAARRPAAVSGRSAVRTDVGAGAGGSEMQFGQSHPCSPRSRTARGPKAAGGLNGGVAEAHGAPAGAGGVCSPARVVWRGPGFLPVRQFSLPMIKTHSRPRRCRPGAAAAASRSQLPCVGPRGRGLASLSAAQGNLSALRPTAAPLRVLCG